MPPEAFIMAKPFFVFLFLALFLAGGCAQTAKQPSITPPSLDDRPVSTLNRLIKDLRFSPINGAGFRLSDLKQAKAVLILMREKDCPISEKYGSRIARIEREYAPKGIRFIYNYVGLIQPGLSAGSDLADFGFKGPYVIDDKRRIVDALGARTTGDVFVLTPDRRVIYKGPVDDQYHLLKAAPNIKNSYLRDLLENIVSGKKIDPVERPAPGCLISRPIALLPKREEKPALVFSLSEPVRIAPTRSFAYKTFLRQTGFKEDRWIKDIKFFLKPKVIHHVAVYIMDSSYIPPPSGFDHHTKALNMARHTEFSAVNRRKSPSVGIRLPRSAQLIWEIHYEPSGRELFDKETRAEIQFHSEQPEYELLTHYYWTPDLHIPPNMSNYRVKRSFRVKKPILLAGLNVHMHLRGKAGEVWLTDPRGKRKRIFGLDPFNPSFERFYRFEAPLKIEKDSTVECLTWFDNSAGNPKNPDPEKPALFGWSLEDEMSNCVFKELVPTFHKTKRHLFIEPFERES